MIKLNQNVFVYWRKDKIRAYIFIYTNCGIAAHINGILRPKRSDNAPNRMLPQMPPNVRNDTTADASLALNLPVATGLVSDCSIR